MENEEEEEKENSNCGCASLKEKTCGESVSDAKNAALRRET